jgi:hypothetical protein
MKCALIRWWMEEYIDGTLQGRRLQWMEKHLQECPACAQELAWHRSLRDALNPEILSAPPQDMWQDFQRRLAERGQPTRTFRPAWWQWGTAAAAAACALVLGVVSWNSQPPVYEAVSPVKQSDTQNVASSAPQAGMRAPERVEASVPPAPALAMGSPAVRSAGKMQATPTKRPAPSPVQNAARPLAQADREVSLPAPQPVASLAYAEVRNEQGELVAKVVLQTTYDENGQPTAVQIECDTPTAVEVENNEQPLDSSNHSDDTRGSAGSPAPTAGSRPGLSD